MKLKKEEGKKSEYTPVLGKSVLSLLHSQGNPFFLNAHDTCSCDAIRLLTKVLEMVFETVQQKHLDQIFLIKTIFEKQIVQKNNHL